MNNAEYFTQQAAYHRKQARLWLIRMILSLIVLVCCAANFYRVLVKNADERNAARAAQIKHDNSAAAIEARTHPHQDRPE